MKYRRRMQPWLGTFVEIGVRAGTSAQQSISAAFSVVAQVHGLMSFHDRASDISRLNTAGGQSVELNPLTITMLRRAKAMTRASEGRFNCTVGGALESLGVLPAPGEPAEIDVGDADDVVILDRRTARLRRPVHVTLDGIAKGFAVDCAIDALRNCGAGEAWVNAGGDMRTIGSISLALALRGTDGFRIAGHLIDCAVATSVTTDLFDERFPGRIVSTGQMPVERGAWTVLARQAWRADALTKVAALAPAAERGARVARLGGRLIITGAAA
jgi:FAD:protein FMN transferase